MSKAKDQTLSAAKDEHYIRAVTELGDTTQVVASQDIYSRKRFFEQRTAIGGGHELEVMLS